MFIILYANFLFSFETDLVLFKWMLITTELHNVYIYVQLCLFCNVAQLLIDDMSQSFSLQSVVAYV